MTQIQLPDQVDSIANLPSPLWPHFTYNANCFTIGKNFSHTMIVCTTDKHLLHHLTFFLWQLFHWNELFTNDRAWKFFEAKIEHSISSLKKMVQSNQQKTLNVQSQCIKQKRERIIHQKRKLYSTTNGTPNQSVKSKITRKQAPFSLLEIPTLVSEI